LVTSLRQATCNGLAKVRTAAGQELLEEEEDEDDREEGEEMESGNDSEGTTM
jgi:hypothetical protein